MNKQDFCNVVGYVPGSYGEKSILDLSESKFQRLLEIVDPKKDTIIFVEPDGVTVNFGSVGSKGVWVNF